MSIGGWGGTNFHKYDSRCSQVLNPPETVAHLPLPLTGRTHTSPLHPDRTHLRAGPPVTADGRRKGTVLTSQG